MTEAIYIRYPMMTVIGLKIRVVNLGCQATEQQLPSSKVVFEIMPQNSYELPTVYTSLEKQQETTMAPSTSSNRPTEMTPHLPPGDNDTRQLLIGPMNGQEETDCSPEEETNTRQRRQSDDSGSLEMYFGQMEQDWWLACLLLSTSFSMLFFTVIPVVANLPDVVPSWFSGDTLWRLFDPLFTLPLNLFIMTRSNVITSGGKPNYCEYLVASSHRPVKQNKKKSFIAQSLTTSFCGVSCSA